MMYFMMYKGVFFVKWHFQEKAKRLKQQARAKELLQQVCNGAKRQWFEMMYIDIDIDLKST